MPFRMYPADDLFQLDQALPLQPLTHGQVPSMMHLHRMLADAIHDHPQVCLL